MIEENFDYAQFTVGNTDLLKLPKTAFLCSRKVPASVVLKCYDWAIEQREKGVCVISGFHSQIEKDVLHYLLKGKQPIIVALARGLKEKLEPDFEKPIEQGRLLIITPFDKSVKRVSEQTAETRNKLMTDLADQITIGFASPCGQLEKLLNGIEKPINKIV
jgi:predicted Rossmann fold nucleotide-binding protein DprA/Smf involved in DNA uptake